MALISSKAIRSVSSQSGVKPPHSIVSGLRIIGAARWKRLAILFLLLLIRPPCANAQAGVIPEYTYRIVEVLPHDPDAYTQGLVFHNDHFYEGTGLYGASTLRRVEPETGKLLERVDLPNNRFGEGITILNGKIYQLTWRSHVGFVYDRATFRRLDSFHYPTEGWGLTHDGQQLIMSDGTATLRFLDPKTLTETRHLRVTGPDGPITRLNELEYIEGEIFSNVWKTDTIVRIDPGSGNLTGKLDLSGLRSALQDSQGVDVLNGIAYDAENDRLFVTGKLWPAIFQIELFQKPSDGQAAILKGCTQQEALRLFLFVPKGTSYTLEMTESLTRPDWTQFGSPFSGTGHVVETVYQAPSPRLNTFLRLKRTQ